MSAIKVSHTHRIQITSEMAKKPTEKPVAKSAEPKKAVKVKKTTTKKTTAKKTTAKKVAEKK